jgi:hypothetical protein
MKILYITTGKEDYLADSLFHGLRNVFHENVIDYPKQECLYKTFDVSSNNTQLYGKGFTLYRLLEDMLIDRENIEQKLYKKYFDLIIFSSIFNMFEIFSRFLPYLARQNTIILDGADTPQPYPYAGKFWRYPPHWFLPKAHIKFLYFKREWTPDTIRNLWYQLPPRWLCQYIPAPTNFRPISFSIPEEKIVKSLPIKTKLFPRHIVDAEVASKVEGSLTSYAFESETEYYADLQASKFGITTKRSGWDCLRHYEIAANGCVPCFRNLDKKPSTCAPPRLKRN